MIMIISHKLFIFLSLFKFLCFHFFSFLACFLCVYFMPKAIHVAYFISCLYLSRIHFSVLWFLEPYFFCYIVLFYLLLILCVEQLFSCASYSYYALALNGPFHLLVLFHCVCCSIQNVLLTYVAIPFPVSVLHHLLIAYFILPL